MNADEDSFGQWVKRRRKALDLTQRGLANKVGCSVSAIHKIEVDERRPSRQIAELLAVCLEIPSAQRELFVRIARRQKGIQHLDSFSFPVAQPSVAPSKGNLPAPSTVLIGRQYEVNVLQEHLRDPACRLLTLTGPGGVGKTRLALAVAHDLQDSFQQGVYFVSLVGTTSVKFILPAIADSLGFSVSQPGEPKAQLFQYLKGKQILLLLDNFEHLLDGASQVSELLKAVPEIKILVTSREPLNLRAEWTFSVYGLPVPAKLNPQHPESNSAAALFLQRARQASLDFSPGDADLDAIQRICQLVQGLPLGLELAAAWVRTLSCQEIAREIEESLDFLSAPTRDAPQRHHSIRAVFDSSWQLLSPREQTVLMKLTVFRGGFTREAAVQVCDASLPVLSTLVGKSLVRHHPDGRYDLHELVRAYANGWLIRTGGYEAVRNRHFQFFLAVVEQGRQKTSGAEQILWLDRLEQDHDNLRAALEWALQPAETTECAAYKDRPAVRDALRLAGELYVFWKRRSHWAEGREWLKRALAQCTCPANTPERLLALNAAALLAVEQADTRTASECAQLHLELARQGGDAHILARAFHTLGQVHWKQKQHADARRLCEEALALFRKLDDRCSVAESLHSLGHIAINQGELEAARAYLLESLSIARDLEYKIAYVEALADLGLVAYLQRDYAMARQYLEESLSRFQEAHLLPGMESVLNRLGDLARAEGDYENADELYQESLSLYREMGDLDEIPSILHNLAYTALHRSEPQKALALFQEALSIQDAMGNHAGIAECLMGIASVLTSSGQHERAARLLGAAEAVRVNAGASMWPADALEYDCMLSYLRAALDEETFAAAWSAGQVLSLEKAVADANTSVL